MADKRVFDCFIFFNELDLLDIRLEECFDSVDLFVICEATKTFRDAPKPLFFAENKARYARYQDKIRHVIVDDMPTGGDPWQREFFQRNALKRGFHDANPEDIIIISDCDEILNPAMLRYVRDHRGYFLFDMPMYQFYLNMMAVPNGWNKPFAYSYYLHDRVPDYNRIRQVPEQIFEQFAGDNHRLSPGGWHFTFLGGAGKVIEKIRAYSHAEAWQQGMLQPGRADRQMMMLKDVGGGRFLEFCEVDASFPASIRRRQHHFVAAGLLKTAKNRFQELRTVVAEYERDYNDLNARFNYQKTELERLYMKSSADVNLALGKPATQSSISAWSIGKTKEEDARGGNDGKINDLYGFHTDIEENPWWRVDLESAYQIGEVRIINRHVQAHRLVHFSIWGSTDDTEWSLLYRKTDDVVFGEGLEPFSVILSGKPTARYVKIQLDGMDCLHFHECLIFGRAASFAQDGTNQNNPSAASGGERQRTTSTTEPLVAAYLSRSGPHALEIGRRALRQGWITSDLDPELGVARIDAAKRFPIPDNSFDFVYSEHMIEHIPFSDGQNMLRECFRILRPGGVLRIATPSIGFLLRLLSSDRGALERAYTEWSVKNFVPHAPATTPAFVFNHFVRGWGHQFIYDRETLINALTMAGFKQIIEYEAGQSSHPMLSNLESSTRMPPGFFSLETMIFEGTK